MSHTIRATHPAGIHQPTFDAITLDLPFEQFSIFGRMMHQERSAKTRGECDRGFLTQTCFCPCELGGIARYELIQSLIRGEPRNRRHHARSVTSEEDNIFRMT